ncbi:MAG TPA: YfhO family protein [Oculatellaceae cyanobacterium]
MMRTLTRPKILSVLLSRVWPLLAMLILWVVFWWPIITGREQLYIRDLTFYALPMKTYMMARFRAGEFPFWTPHISTGMPFFAEPTHQVLYPFNLLFFLTPTEVHGISWFVILHLLLAQWAFYALCRTLGFGQWLSLWGGLLFGYVGYTLSIGDNVNYLPATVWCPLALAAFMRGLQTGRMQWAAVVAASVTSMLFAGDTFNPLFLALFCALFLLCRWKISAFRDWVSGCSNRWALVFFGVSFVLAALLGAVQILPTQELLALSVRNAPLALKEIALWSFPPERVIELVHPYFYGSKYPTPHFIGQFMYPKFLEPWADSVYIGLIPVFFAGLALVCQFRKHLLWAMMAGFSLLASFGLTAPYYPFLLKLFPPLQYHRYQEKFLFWVTLVVCVLAVSGLQYAIQHRGQLFHAFRQKGLGGRIAWTVGILAFGTLFLCKIPIDLWIWEHAMERSVEWGEHFYERGPHVAQLYAHWLLLALVLLVLPWLRQSHRFYLPCVCVFAVLDLLFVHWGQVPSAPTELLTRRPTPVALQLIRKDHPDGPIRILFDDKVELVDQKDEKRVLQRISDAYRVPLLMDNYPVYWIYRFLYNQNRLLFNFGTIYNVGYQNGRFEPLQQKRHQFMDEVLLQNNPALLPALCATPYIVSSKTTPNSAWRPEDTEIIGEDPGFNLRILKVKRAVPRAYIAPNAIYNPEPEKVFKILTQSFLSHPYEQQVEIAKNAPGSTAQELTPLLPNARVDFVQDMPELIELRVDSPYPGKDAHLVLTESMFPGWRAFVDGQEVPVYLANQRFMAISIPPGRHHVVFRYQSTRFAVGLGLSVLGVLLAIGCCFIRKKRISEAAV